MKSLMFATLLFLLSCNQKPQDPFQKYGFCKGVVIVETISKDSILIESPMIISTWTLARYNLKQNCRVDSLTMMKLIKSDLELTGIMVNELKSQQ